MQPKPAARFQVTLASALVATVWLALAAAAYAAASRVPPPYEERMIWPAVGFCCVLASLFALLGAWRSSVIVGVGSSVASALVTWAYNAFILH